MCTAVLHPSVVETDFKRGLLAPLTNVQALTRCSESSAVFLPKAVVLFRLGVKSGGVRACGRWCHAAWRVLTVQQDRCMTAKTAAASTCAAMLPVAGRSQRQATTLSIGSLPYSSGH